MIRRQKIVGSFGQKERIWINQGLNLFQTGSVTSRGRQKIPIPVPQFLKIDQNPNRKILKIDPNPKNLGLGLGSECRPLVSSTGPPMEKLITKANFASVNKISR